MVSVQKIKQNDTGPCIELIDLKGATFPWSFADVNLRVDHCNLSRSKVKILCYGKDCTTEFHTSTLCFVSATKNTQIKFCGCLFACANIQKTAITIEDSNVTIVNSTFRGNHKEAQGHILQISNGSLHVCRSLFENFRTKSGVISLSNINQCILHDCVFQNNRAAMEMESTGMPTISIWGSFSIKISGCRFTNNTAPFGGTLYIWKTWRVVVSDCFFQNNSALQAPGIYGKDLVKLSVQNCTFAFNNAFGNIYKQFPGGVIKTLNSQGIIQNCDFKSNTGGTNIWGVCLAPGTNSVFVIQNSFFFNNTGNFSMNMLGTIALHQNTSGTIQYCNFKYNKIPFGVVSVWNSRAFITFSNFTNNTVVNGGAVYATTKADVHLRSIRFKNNYATGSGGAVYAERSTTIIVINSLFRALGAAFRGGAFYIADSTTLKLTGNLFFAMSDNILCVQVHSKVSVLNCSISDCKASFVKASSSSVTISNSNIFHNTIVIEDMMYLSYGSTLSVIDSSIYQNVQASVSSGVLIRAVSNSFFKIRNSSVQRNVLYGIVVITNGKATVQKCEFKNNSATALSLFTLQSKCHLWVEQSTFSVNSGYQPGAIVHADSSSVFWNNNVVIQNKGIAPSSGGDTGGGVFFGSRTNITIKDSTIVNNSCNDPGFVAFVLCDEPCFLEIINSSLRAEETSGKEGLAIFFLQNVTNINIESSMFFVPAKRLFLVEGAGEVAMRISKSVFRSASTYGPFFSTSKIFMNRN